MAPQHPQPLLSILQETFPDVSSYNVLSSVEQANASGYLVRLKSESASSSTTPPTVFVKYVSARDHLRKPNKQWANIRRTLLYIRTEVRFYAEFVPLLGGGIKTPRISKAHNDLEGLIDESSRATASSTSPGYEPNNWKQLADTPTTNKNTMKGGYLIMESMAKDPTNNEDETGGATTATSSLPSHDYYQESPLSIQDCRKTLSAIAKLHAAAWQDTSLLQQADERLSKGSYHLSIRNPSEWDGMVDSWKQFGDAFAAHDDEWKSIVQEHADLGQRIQQQAAFISKELTPSPTDPHATLVHGDFKSMNCFLPKEDESVVLLDFASIGVGVGMSDVAMHLTHAIRPEDLRDHEEDLIDHYLSTLKELLQASNKAVYPKAIAMRHYRLATLDYFRFVLGRFWKSATPQSFAQKANSPNTTLVNRNHQAAKAFIRRAATYLDALEQEQQE